MTDGPNTVPRSAIFGENVLDMAVSNRRGAIRINAEDEFDALLWIRETYHVRYSQMSLTDFTDNSGTGWLLVEARRPMRGSSQYQALKFLVSPTGRVWTINEYEGTPVEPPVREKSYDS